ncbi:MAG: lipopolysaccharide biosynthesis protein [Planctomycetaceae bacterium]
MSTSADILNALPVADSQPGPLKKLVLRFQTSEGLSSLLAVFDQGMISGTSFVSAILIGRACGAEILGIFSLVASALAMMVGVQDQLITAPYVVNHHRCKGTALRRYAGSMLLHHLILNTLMLASLFLVVWKTQTSSDEIRTVARVLVFAGPAMLLRAFIRELALAHCRTLHVVLLDLAVCGTQLITILLLFTTDFVQLPLMYSAVGVACVAAAVIWWKHHRTDFQFRLPGVVSHWYRNWKFGRWALATHLAGTSTPYIMPWILFLMHGRQATGYLASCSVIVGVANILLSGMSDYVTPRAARSYASGGIAELKQFLRRVLMLAVPGIGSVCVVSAIFGEQIIAALYDGRFPGAGQIVTLMTLSVLANAIGSAAGNGLWALHQPRANFVADMITLTAVIAATPALVAPYGAWGAAAASLVACVLGAVCRTLIFRQCSAEATARPAR